MKTFIWKIFIAQVFIIWVIIITLKERAPSVGTLISTPSHHAVLAWLRGKGLRGEHLSPGFPNTCHEKVFSRQGVPFWPTPDCTHWMSRNRSTRCALREDHRPFPVPSMACPHSLLLAFMGRSNQNTGAITHMSYIYCVKLKSITPVFAQISMWCWIFQ